jgi:hypothetical protein
MATNRVNFTGGEAELPTQAVNLNHAGADEAVETATLAPGTSAPSIVMPPQPPMSAKFDPARLRVSQSFGELAGTRKVLTSVPVTKPNKQQWVRVHPEAAYRENFALIEVKESRTLYLVEPNLTFELETEVIYATVYTAMTREGTVFLWPVPLPDASGRPCSWHESAREAASEAVNRWVRVAANMGNGSYDYWVAPGTLSEPTWPEMSYAMLLSIAFKGERYIDSLDHPLVARLKGVK